MFSIALVGGDDDDPRDVAVRAHRLEHVAVPMTFVAKVASGSP